MFDFLPFWQRLQIKKYANARTILAGKFRSWEFVRYMLHYQVYVLTSLTICQILRDELCIVNNMSLVATKVNSQNQLSVIQNQHNLLPEWSITLVHIPVLCQVQVPSPLFSSLKHIVLLAVTTYTWYAYFFLLQLLSSCDLGILRWSLLHYLLHLPLVR